jgi:hypothetical protein
MTAPKQPVAPRKISIGQLTQKAHRKRSWLTESASADAADAPKRALRDCGGRFPPHLATCSSNSGVSHRRWLEDAQSRFGERHTESRDAETVRRVG